MTSIGHDLCYGARSLVKNPGFTLLAAGTLALGIGVNTTIFSLVNTLLFAELPITDPDTFGLVEAVSTESNDTESPATLADFALLTEDTNVFVDTAVAVRKHFVLTGEGEPAYVQALSVSANYFELWGVGTVLGRGFADGEDRPGAPPVTVLSHGFWSRHYGEDPNVVGDEILLDGQPYTIVGILSPKMEFGFLAQIDIWVGLRVETRGNLSGHASRLDAPSTVRLRSLARRGRPKFRRDLERHGGARASHRLRQRRQHGDGAGASAIKLLLR